MKSIEADYCIVGGGAAGCVLAARLSEDPGVRVVLIEAGPRDWHPFVHIPAACMFLQHDARFNWLDRSVPQVELDRREVTIPQGRLLGGSGSINGMLHVRPQPSDVDGWATSGWSWDEVEPLLRRAERYAGSGEERGHEGPHPVSDFAVRHPLSRAFVDACGAVGIAENADMNGANRAGAAFFQQNRSGRFRAQTAQSYLRAARRRENLEVLTSALCRRVTFDGQRATGVVYRQGGEDALCRVRGEVILSAGALRSPQMLQVSGIGDPAELGRIGVDVVAASHGVGRNLKDHFLLRVSHRVTGIGTINERTRGLPLLRELVKYALSGQGLLTMGAGAAAAILSGKGPGGVPDMQLSFAPGSFAAPGVMEREPGMTIGGWMSPGHGAGTVRATGRDTAERPAIDLRYLSEQADRDGVVACIRTIRRIFAAPPLARWSAGEVFPGTAIGDTADEILAFARERGGSGYHFAGTCRMGDDERSVVDPRLRVRGVTGLRVVDASVMPAPPIGNAHASVVMVAEKGAEMIRQDARAALCATGEAAQDPQCKEIVNA